ncbi:VOC family protein [Nocardioides sp. MH1]|uniref:VOC family protein n=1 Tax=Nocardioides sp. MH1 TaxID=3242490 RepID=UPI003521BE47
MTPAWVTAFLDLAPGNFEDGVRFWAALTGYDVSPPRGESDQFATLVPRDGDAYLRVQRIEEGDDRVHLDLHVPDPGAAAARAVGHGATVVADRGDYVVLRSPGGLAFCFVTHRAEVRPRPTTWSGGHSSLLDQVCIDIPASSYDRECDFWRDLSGWEMRSSPVSEFRSLVRPQGQPIRLLLQRLEDETGEVRAHLDWATTDRAAETERHLALGARVLDPRPGWTVLADPTGRRYCITDRDPETGVLG